MEKWDDTADVVIVGYGIAGVCAALAVREQGADALVLERASDGGGTSALSSGIFYMGGTALQSELGVADDAEQMYNFMRASCGDIDADTLKVFCEGCPEHFDWLERHGVPFARSIYPDKHMCPPTSEGLLSTGNEKVWPYREQARPAMRGHRVEQEGDNAGQLAMAALLQRAREAGVRVMGDTKVNELLTDEAGRVIGVAARSAGRDVRVRATGGVVLATGGYQMNREMMAEHVPFLLEHGEAIGGPYSDGSGIALGLSVGAATQALDAVHATASFYPPSQLIRGIIVNSSGERFVAEDSYHGRTAAHIFEQNGQKAFLIVDSKTFAYPELGEFFRYALIDGWETVAEMEHDLAIPAGALQATLETYNRDAAAGNDSAFGKYPDWLTPQDTAPWAAFDLSVGSALYHYHTLGGLRVDAAARVLAGDGTPIAGLYAAGSCAATIVTDAKGYGSGMTLSSGSLFGRIAGGNAAREKYTA